METPCVAREVTEGHCQTDDREGCIYGHVNRDFIFRGLFMCLWWRVMRGHVRTRSLFSEVGIAIGPQSGHASSTYSHTNEADLSGKAILRDGRNRFIRGGAAAGGQLG